MNNQKRLQNIWALTDKSAIDAMTEKTRSPLSMTASESSSSDGGSDSEASNSTYGSFVAVPKEFRPYLPSTKLEGAKHLTDSSPSAAIPKSLVQHSNSQVKNHSRNDLKVSLSKDESHVADRCSNPPIPNTLGQKKQNNLMKDQNSFEDRALAYEISSQNPEKTASNIKCDNVDNRKMSSLSQKKVSFGLESFEKQHCATKLKNSRPRPNLNELKYECVEKQIQETLHLNFKVPSCKDRKSHPNDNIQYEIKVSQGERKRNKAVIWQSNLGGSRSRTRHHRSEMPRQTLHEKNVRWDNTLNFSGRTEIALDSDSDNNTEDKIEWRVIKEQNITVPSTRKVKAEKNAQNEFTVEYESRFADSNQVKKHNKRYHPRSLSNNARSSQTNLNRSKLRTNYPKCILTSKETNSSENKNLNLDNSNVKCIKNKFLNTNVRHSSEFVDNDIFTRQCRLHDPVSTLQNIQDLNSISSSRSNDAVAPNLVELNMPVNSSDKRGNYFIQGSQTTTQGAKESGIADLRAIEAKRNTILEYGREMLDLIIGSHTALSLFFATYDAWKKSRQQLIDHFETLERNLKKTSKKFARYKDIINMARTCASTAELIPIPHISLAAKVVTIVTGLFSKVFKTDSAKADVEDSNEITTAVFRDAHSSGELYMYGLQCHQQFEETAKYIEEFHTKVRDLQYFDVEYSEMTYFIESMLEYKPNHRTFYAKLYMCFQQLQLANLHDFSRRFCEPLIINPPAVEIVKFLSWRFRYEEFSPQSVQFEMEQLHNMIQDSNISIKDLLARVQSLLRLLHSELGFLETCVKDVTLFNGSFCQSDMKKIAF